MIRKRGVTQRQLALASGTEEYQISNWASGKKFDLLLSTMQKICRALHCTLDEAFGDDDLDQNAWKGNKKK